MKTQKLHMKALLLCGFLAASNLLFSQGLIQQSISTLHQHESDDTLVSCASYHLMEHVDKIQPGFLKAANQYLENIQSNTVQHKKANANVYQIPVVFHIVYNDTAANVADSVIQDQLNVLNRSFRRQNTDTSNTRADFKPIVGDSKIEFVLASTDPNGNPTNGITRTYSSTKYFGGVLPYSQSQQQQIQTWVNDSLFYNFFRITQDSLTGKSAWDSEKYINIWVGDFRIFEPKVNNAKELVYFGLSTPPANHPNWPSSIYTELAGFEEGILLHYPVVGSNNPNTFPAPYTPYNPLVRTGKMLVHEMGHYLGLRHIWGDGDCTMDDFIDDTPRTNKSSAFDCNSNSNNCVDTILGNDLPDMVENYMDYSSGDCQNSFTQGQINVMRTVIENYRPNLLSVQSYNNTSHTEISYFPNPTADKVTVSFNSENTDATINVLSIDGRLIQSKEIRNSSSIEVSLGEQNGLYIIQVQCEGEVSSFKVMKQ